jgi:DNA-damage-inducible protein J
MLDFELKTTRKLGATQEVVMASKQLATRVSEDEDRRFRETTRAIGTTPADALRMFISAFNAAGGFPYTPRVRRVEVEAFDSEEDAARFATRLARKMIDAER